MLAAGRVIAERPRDSVEITSIDDPETVRFRSAFRQHLGRLVEQGDAGTVRRVVRQPVRCTARKVHETAMCEPANNARQQSSLGLEHLWVRYRGRPRT